MGPILPQRFLAPAVTSILLLSLGCKTPTEGESDTRYLDIDKAKAKAANKVIEIPNNGTTEHCVIIGGYPELGPEQEKRVFGSKKLEDLCALRFGDMNADHAVCPKDNSTNPGVEIIDIAGLGVSRSDFENKSDSSTNKVCNDSNKAHRGEKLAKFKGTVTCSDTGSIVMYYYIGRMLDIGNIPATVIRTLNVDTMREVTKRGLKTPIAASWKIWLGILDGSASAEVRDLTLTDDKRFVYGALSDNPAGEDPYPGHNVKPYSAFAGTRLVKKAMSPGSTGDILEGTKGLKAYALASEIKGMSDMIILDTLLSQQDRLGNVSSKTVFYGVDPSTNEFGSERKKAKADARFGAGQHVEATEMLMKDNDCGLRGNSTVFLENRSTEKLRHLSPETYVRLRWLMGELKSGRLEKFAKEVGLREDGGTLKGRWGNTAIASLKEGMARMDKDFYNRCMNGTLQLDLDPADLARNGAPAASELRRRCDLVWDPKGVASASAPWDSKDGATTEVHGPIMSAASPSTGSSSGSGSAPNACTSTAGDPGICISTADCSAKGPAFSFETARCLRDPAGIFCCFKP